MSETHLFRDLRQLHERIVNEAHRIGEYDDDESAAEARAFAGCARRVEEMIRRHAALVPIGRVDLGGGTTYRVEGEPGMTAEAWTEWIESTGKTPVEAPTYELRPLTDRAPA